MKGKLIVIEGACDGVGKTTQYNLLKKYLEEKGYNVYSHHFPSYNSKQGKLASEYLNGDFGNPKELSPYLINSMYAVDRALTWKLELKEKYENGSIILLDRYTTSSLIYQSSLFETNEEKEEFINYVTYYEYEKLGLKKPDLVIFLTGDFNIFTELRKNRKDYEGNSNDIHESDINFMKKIYDNSSFVAEKLGFKIINCTKDGKLRDINDIHNEIKQILNN